jgi:histidyl-tRNA synthetase
LYAFQQLQRLRAAGINADLYPEPAKLKKQMKYANDRQVPYVILIGEEEMASGEVTLKNMVAGTQEKKSIEDLIAQKL